MERFLLWLTAACAEWKWYGFASNDDTSCHFQNKHSSSLHAGHQTNTNIHHLHFSSCPTRFPSFSSSTGRKLLGISGTGFHAPNALPVVTRTVSQYTHTICTACNLVTLQTCQWIGDRAFCLEQAADRPEAATHFVENWKTFLFESVFAHQGTCWSDLFCDVPSVYQ